MSNYGTTENQRVHCRQAHIARRHAQVGIVDEFRIGLLVIAYTIEPHQKTATKEGSIKNRLTFAFDFLKDLLKTQ